MGGGFSSLPLVQKTLVMALCGTMQFASPSHCEGRYRQTRHLPQQWEHLPVMGAVSTNQLFHSQVSPTTAYCPRSDSCGILQMLYSLLFHLHIVTIRISTMVTKKKKNLSAKIIHVCDMCSIIQLYKLHNSICKFCHFSWKDYHYLLISGLKCNRKMSQSRAVIVIKRGDGNSWTHPKGRRAIAWQTHKTMKWLCHTVTRP